MSNLDNLEKKTKQELKVRYEKFMTEIDKDLQQLEEMLSKLEIEANKLQTWEEDNESQQFINLKKAEQITRESNTLEANVATLAGSEYLQFDLNRKVIDTFCDINFLGEFSFFSLEFSERFVVKTNENRYICHITDLCILSDGSIVLADFNNSCIKKLDTSYKVTAECAVSASPTAICSISPTEVAIGLFASGIHFATVTNHISMTRTFSIGGYCSSIAYNNGELFVALQDYNGSKNVVKVYNIHDDVQCLRSLASNMESHYFITISSEGDIAHLANAALGLFTTDGEGHKLWENTELKGICGITSAEKNSLIVCCEQHQQISFLLIGKDGKKITEIHGIEETPNRKPPSSLLYDATNSKLIVSFGHCVRIYVYNVKLTL